MTKGQITWKLLLLVLCTCPGANAVDILETFDAGVIGTHNGTSVVWTDGGDAPWMMGNTGLLPGDHYTSGPITHNQTSELTLDVVVAAGGGSLSFDWAASSELGFDFLNVVVNGTNELDVSGNLSGAFLPFALSPGLNTIDFIYDKDGSVSALDDLGRIDNVSVTNVVPEPATGLITLGLLALLATRRR